MINPSYYRPLVPNSCRRATWHDYHSRCIYLITINKNSHTPAFSTLEGIPGSHDWKPRTIPTPTGEIIASCLSHIKDNFPDVKILRRVIMPQHLHFVLFNTVYTDYHLGDIISRFKQNCLRSFYGIKDVETNGIITAPSLFEDNYHDRILLKKDQLQRMLAYVSDNPRRRLERMRHSDFFYRSPVISSQGIQLEAYGNIHLLEDPDIEAVKISRKYTANELRMRKIRWMKTVQNGGVLVSPFISADEKKVKNWACDNGGRLILIENNGFGHNYTPKGYLHQLCSEGRLLIIAPSEHSTRKTTTTRESCLSMNALAEEISSYGLSL